MSEQSMENIYDEDFPNKRPSDIKVAFEYGEEIASVIRNEYYDRFDMNIVPFELTYSLHEEPMFDAVRYLVTCSAELTNGDIACLSFTLTCEQTPLMAGVKPTPTLSNVELECRLAGTETDVYYDYDMDSWMDNQNREYDSANGGLKLR